MSVKVAIDISPTKTGHATRGIGVYTRNLIQSLEQEGKRAGEQELKIEFIDLVNQQSAISNQQFDLVHYPYFDLFYLTLPLRKFTKTVVTIHDVIPLTLSDHYPPGIKGKIKFEIQKHSLRDVEAVITDSENSKKDIIQYLGYPSEKIHVVYLAPSDVYKQINLTSSMVRIIRLKYQLPRNFVLYVGDINYNKNIPALVKACEKVKIPLVIVGKQATEKNFDRSHPENQDLVWLQEKYQSSISLTGFVPDEELVKIYNLATVYCQPSLYEGFGLPVLEAMACGCPVVSSNKSSLPEVCGEAAVMVDPCSEDDIARGLEKVIRGKKTRDTLIKKGLAQATKFSWKKTAKEVINVYREAASDII